MRPSNNRLLQSFAQNEDPFVIDSSDNSNDDLHELDFHNRKF